MNILRSPENHRLVEWHKMVALLMHTEGAHRIVMSEWQVNATLSSLDEMGMVLTVTTDDREGLILELMSRADAIKKGLHFEEP